MVFFVRELAPWKKDHADSHGLFSYGEMFSMEFPMVFDGSLIVMGLLGSSHQQQIEFSFMGATRIDILFEIQLNLESAGCQLHANSC